MTGKAPSSSDHRKVRLGTAPGWRRGWAGAQALRSRLGLLSTLVAAALYAALPAIVEAGIRRPGP